MLLQLGAASALLLQAVPGQGIGVQGEEQENERDAAHMPGRPVLQHRHAEKESRLYSAKKVYSKATKRKR